MNTLRTILLSLCFFLLPLHSVAQGDSEVSPININTADVKALASILKGVGPSKAQAIVAYRDSYGEFKSVDELVEVKGIGLSLININRELIVLK